MLSDLSSRIKRAKERLALTQEKEERYREQMAQQATEGSGNKVNHGFYLHGNFQWD